MNKLMVYGLGGVAAVVVASALIKKRPGMATSNKMLIGPGRALGPPKSYVAAPGDTAGAVGQRFGFRVAPARRGLKLRPGAKVPLLGKNLADTGPRPGARGVAS